MTWVTLTTGANPVIAAATSRRIASFSTSCLARANSAIRPSDEP